jgi:DNA repair protein RadD
LGLPPVSCCILARPTKQLGTYRQMIGRVLRTAEGKRDARILDHAGAYYRHGLPADDISWTLDVDRLAENVTAAARKCGEKAEIGKCPDCSAILAGPPPCWSCGWMPARRGRAVDFAEGELGLVIGDRARANAYDRVTRDRWHAELAYIAQERGYQRGWVAHKYKTKFGVWPAWGVNLEPAPPTPEVRSWVRSRDIAYAKSRSAA